MDSAALIAALSLDFKPADVGDTEEVFAGRLAAVVARALAREDATQGQQEQHARALLIGAQIRELLRQVEVFRREGKLTVEQGIAARVAALRVDEAAAMTRAGLAPAARGPRRSASIPLEVSF